MTQRLFQMVWFLFITGCSCPATTVPRTSVTSTDEASAAPRTSVTSTDEASAAPTEIELTRFSDVEELPELYLGPVQAYIRNLEAQGVEELAENVRIVAYTFGVLPGDGQGTLVHTAAIQSDGRAIENPALFLMASDGTSFIVRHSGVRCSIDGWLALERLVRDPPYGYLNQTRAIEEEHCSVILDQYWTHVSQGPEEQRRAAFELFVRLRALNNHVWRTQILRNAENLPTDAHWIRETHSIPHVIDISPETITASIAVLREGFGGTWTVRGEVWTWDEDRRRAEHDTIVSGRLPLELGGSPERMIPIDRLREQFTDEVEARLLTEITRREATVELNDEARAILQEHLPSIFRGSLPITGPLQLIEGDRPNALRSLGFEIGDVVVGLAGEHLSAEYPLPTPDDYANIPRELFLRLRLFDALRSLEAGQGVSVELQRGENLVELRIIGV